MSSEGAQLNLPSQSHQGSSAFVHSLTAVSVAMRAKSCVSTLAFDVTYYVHLLIHAVMASKKTAHKGKNEHTTKGL